VDTPARSAACRIESQRGGAGSGIRGISMPLARAAGAIVAGAVVAGGARFGLGLQKFARGLPRKESNEIPYGVKRRRAR
jgi:hypothetical protein